MLGAISPTTESVPTPRAASPPANRWIASPSSANVYELVPAASRIAAWSASSSAQRSTWAVIVTSGMVTSGSGLAWVSIPRALPKRPVSRQT